MIIDFTKYIFFTNENEIISQENSKQLIDSLKIELTIEDIQITEIAAKMYGRYPNKNEEKINNFFSNGHLFDKKELKAFLDDFKNALEKIVERKIIYERAYFLILGNEFFMYKNSLSPKIIKKGKTMYPDEVFTTNTVNKSKRDLKKTPDEEDTKREKVYQIMKQVIIELENKKENMLMLFNEISKYSKPTKNFSRDINEIKDKFPTITEKEISSILHFGENPKFENFDWNNNNFKSLIDKNKLSIFNIDDIEEKFQYLKEIIKETYSN